MARACGRLRRRAGLPFDRARNPRRRAAGDCRTGRGLARAPAMSEGLPAGVDEFLAEAGWGGAAVEPLPGDASFRRYFRVRKGEANAMLMDAPPPHEDPGPFLHVGKWLRTHGMRAPEIY